MVIFMDTSEESEFAHSDQGMTVYDYIKSYPNKYYILNFCSNYPVGTQLHYLIPSPELQLLFFNGMDEEFKRQYIQYVFDNKEAFLEFIMIMVYDYYSDAEGCIVLTNLHNQIISCVIDYLIELYNWKYKYVPTIGSCIEDLIKSKDNNFPPEFMQALIADKEYFIYNTTDPNMLIQNSTTVEDYNGRMV